MSSRLLGSPQHRPGAHRADPPVAWALVQVRPSTTTLALAEPFGIARGSRTEQPVIQVEVEADGVVGRGEAAPIYYRGESVESALAFLERVRLPSDPFVLEAALP